MAVLPINPTSNFPGPVAFVPVSPSNSTDQLPPNADFSKTLQALNQNNIAQWLMLALAVPASVIAVFQIIGYLGRTLWLRQTNLGESCNLCILCRRPHRAHYRDVELTKWQKRSLSWSPLPKKHQ